VDQPVGAHRATGAGGAGLYALPSSRLALRAQRSESSAPLRHQQLPGSQHPRGSLTGILKERIPDAALSLVELPLARRIRGQLPGDERSLGRGPGLELDRIRPYLPGDDIRTIDWNVSARTGETHVREHVPERDVTTWLLVDRSPSMHFGTADRRKADVQEGVARVFGHLATRRRGRLGVIAFGAGAGAVLVARPGPHALGRLAAHLGRDVAEEGSGPTSMTP
jgi:uncharacterized protein (DUF58 family)